MPEKAPGTNQKTKNRTRVAYTNKQNSTPMKWTGHIAFLLLLAGIAGCSEQKQVSPRTYLQWVQNPANGLQITHKKGPYTFTMQFEPLPYKALKRTGLSNSGASNKQAIRRAKAEMEGLQYFLLKVSAKQATRLLPDKKDGKPDKKLHNYLAYDIYQDVKLLQGNDTLDCVMHNYEPPIQGAQYLRLQFAFKPAKNAPKTNKTILLQDNAWTRQTIHFQFDKKDLANIPTLKL